jgi:predicted RNase H-like nuclease
MGKWLYEVYPGPTVKALRDRDTLQAYKHARIEKRAKAIRLILGDLEKQDHLRAPELARLSGAWVALRPSGAAIQRATDELDALISAQLARDFWRGKSGDRVSVVGTREEGFIVFRPSAPEV